MWTVKESKEMKKRKSRLVQKRKRQRQTEKQSEKVRGYEIIRNMSQKTEIERTRAGE